MRKHAWTQIDGIAYRCANVKQKKDLQGNALYHDSRAQDKLFKHSPVQPSAHKPPLPEKQL